MAQDTRRIFEPIVGVSSDAPEATKQLWSLHGHPLSDRYSNPSLNSIGALVEYAAASYKNKTAYIYPASEEDSYRTMTWEIQPTVALLGRATGIEFYISIVALQKLDIRTLLLSTALWPETTQVLCDHCGALAVIVDEEYSVTPLSIARTIPLIEDPFDLPKSTTGISLTGYEDGLHPWSRPSIIVHSSGSTGAPKPIIHTNRSLLLIARPYRLHTSYHNQNWYLLFALSAIASNVILTSGFPHGLPTIFPPRRFPPSPRRILNCLDITARQPYEKTTRDFSALRNLKLLQSGGAPLAQHVTNRLLEEGVNLKQVYGSSELHLLMRTYPHDRSNQRVETMRLMPLPGIDTHVEMEPVDAGFYELIVHQGYPCAAELWGSGLGTQVEPGQVFRTNDLFVRDEMMGEGNWILKGRRDDMIILASGALNVSAVEVESAVKEEGEGLIRTAMLVGHGREKTGLLIELQEDA
ncbi:MAG: hypothetical protein Q9226_003168 [Calogaya cf. arnoldii]